MAWAQRTGVLHEFNSRLPPPAARRLEAQRRGERFMGLRAGDAAYATLVIAPPQPCRPLARRRLGDPADSG
jgi:hypothetical protein